MNKEQQNEQEVNTGSLQVSERRRRLLQASAASASLIGTLRSGAALANVSAFQCLINDEQDQSSLNQLSSSQQPGGWLQVRVERRLYVHQNPNNNTQLVRYWYDGGSVGPWFDESPPGFLSLSTRPGRNFNLDSTTYQYALLYTEHTTDYTDATGLSLINHHQTNWMAVTGSCWASFGGAA